MNRFVFPLLAGGLLALSMLCQAVAQPLPRRLTPPPGSAGFGASVTVLANGNLVVTDPDWTGPGNVEKAGAVYLYDGATLQVISTLTGSRAGDQVGIGGVRELSNDRYAVLSHYWNGFRGAVTWCRAATGLDGEVSPSNSLTGGSVNDRAGIGGVTLLGNGNCVVVSSLWSAGRGAVTWCGEAADTVGEISAANSLVGAAGSETEYADRVGFGGIGVLPNGNYLVFSREWGRARGAITWGSGAAGVRGVVSDANSLTAPEGTRTRLGSSGMAGVVPLGGSGNYVIRAAGNGLPGSVIWFDGDVGVTGQISPANALMGMGGSEVRLQVMGNGDYVVSQPSWNSNRGAVTWGSAAAGVRGAMSPAISLTGAHENDGTGWYGVTFLANGHYVVPSPWWNGNRGAVTWCGGAGGRAGVVSQENSLTGSAAEDRLASGGITPLANGHYVVSSPRWNGNRGAVTWCGGTAAVTGQVSGENSLVGTRSGAPAGDYMPGDAVGSAGVTALAQGNYVVGSMHWNKGLGAVTWGSGTEGVKGALSAENSLIGQDEYNAVNAMNVTALPGGDYLVNSSSWNNGCGAVTWGSGRSGVRGVISPDNSLTGTHPMDRVGNPGVTVLANGNYVVSSGGWAMGCGAVTWGRGTEGVRGEVSAANSLTGTDRTDHAGAAGVTRLASGDYAVLSPGWNGGRGAVTWGSGQAGVKGVIAAGNSLTGSVAEDGVGMGGLVELGNGNYVISSWGWRGQRGALTWAKGGGPLTGEVSAANSLTGSTEGDRIGYLESGTLADLITILANGNYLARSPYWGGGRGAITWGSGAAGVAGTVSAVNSYVDTTLQGGEQSLKLLDNGDWLILRSLEAWLPDFSDRAFSESVILGDGTLGLRGYRNDSKGFQGDAPTLKKCLVTAHDKPANRLIVGWPAGNVVALFPLTAGIGVHSAQGVDVLNESIPARERGTDFGSVPVEEGSASQHFRVIETGAHRLVLTGSPPVTVTGADARDFTVTLQPAFITPDDAEPTFSITFNPSAPGPRTAVVSIASNSAGPNPFTFPIQGTGGDAAPAPYEVWRAASFGNAATERTAPAEDFDGDGVSNLLEFAFGTDPADSAGGAPPLSYTGPLTGPEGGTLAGRGGPIVVRAQDGVFTAVWLRRLDILGRGLKYTPQFSAGLQTWQDAAAEPVVLASDGVTEAVTVPFPAAGQEGKARFFRLAVTLTP